MNSSAIIRWLIHVSIEVNPVGVCEGICAYTQDLELYFIIVFVVTCLHSLFKINPNTTPLNTIQYKYSVFMSWLIVFSSYPYYMTIPSRLHDLVCCTVFMTNIIIWAAKWLQNYCILRLSCVCVSVRNDFKVAYHCQITIHCNTNL